MRSGRPSVFLRRCFRFLAWRQGSTAGPEIDAAPEDEFVYWPRISLQVVAKVSPADDRTEKVLQTIKAETELY